MSSAGLGTPGTSSGAAVCLTTLIGPEALYPRQEQRRLLGRWVLCPPEQQRTPRIFQNGQTGSMSQRGSALVTLLFTDLVASTELLARLGDDAAEEVRRAHFSLLRDAVAAAGGEEVKSLGDGLMVAFPSAVDALGCAVTVQRRVDEHNRRRAGPALQVRVGLHAGEPVRDEGDFHGEAVVVAKRLCDQATGGQILTSELVAGLVGSRGGFRFRSVGQLRLDAGQWPPPQGDRRLPGLDAGKLNSR